MTTNNFIQGQGGGSGQPGDVGDAQPTTPGFWNSNGVLMYWDGIENKPIDFSEGENVSVFGTPLGDQ